MKRMIEPKLKLVASGEYDEENHRYNLDNPLQHGKIYMIIWQDDDTSQPGLYSVILNTCQLVKTPEATFVSSIYGDDDHMCDLILYPGEYNYLIEAVLAGEYLGYVGCTIAVYELPFSI